MCSWVHRITGYIHRFAGFCQRFIGSQNLFTGLQDMFIGSQAMFIGSLDMFTGSQDMFIGSLDMFIGSQDMFIGFIWLLIFRWWVVSNPYSGLVEVFLPHLNQLTCALRISETFFWLLTVNYVLSTFKEFHLDLLYSYFVGYIISLVLWT